MTPLSKTIRFTRPLASASLSEGESETVGEVNVVGETLQLMPYELEAIKLEAYKAGEKAGRAQAEAAFEAEFSQKIESFERTTQEFCQLKADLLQEMHEAIPELVFEAVGRLMSGWKPDAETVKEIVVTLLNDFDAGEHQMRVRLNPEALQLLEESNLDQFKESFPQLEFRGDSRLEAGECVLEGRFGLSDARYSEKLKNLREVMTDD